MAQLPHTLGPLQLSVSLSPHSQGHEACWPRVWRGVGGTWGSGFSSQRSKEDRRAGAAGLPQWASPETASGLYQGPPLTPGQAGAAGTGNSQYTSTTRNTQDPGAPSPGPGERLEEGCGALLSCGSETSAPSPLPGATGRAPSTPGPAPLTDEGGARPSLGRGLLRSREGAGPPSQQGSGGASWLPVPPTQL